MYIANEWKDYEIIDTGEGDKLERWGNIVLRRPDPQIIWPLNLRSKSGKIRMPGTTAVLPAEASGSTVTSSRRAGSFSTASSASRSVRPTSSTQAYSRSKPSTGAG